MKTSALEDFLNAEPTMPESVNYIASDRFKDSKGNYLVWELRPLTMEEYDQLRTECRKKATSKKEGFNQGKFTDLFNDECMVRCTVSPDLNNAQLQDKFGAVTPLGLLKKMLCTAGEWTNYLEKVIEINRYASDVYEEAAVEAKNE